MLCRGEQCCTGVYNVVQGCTVLYRGGLCCIAVYSGGVQWRCTGVYSAV